jgi:two-component system, NarL family, nitrate/nitrite response regulator NarL
MIRVLLADDHQLFIDGLKSFLQDERDIQIAGEALTGLQVLEFLEKEKVDVVVLDIHMPEMDGMETLKILKKKHPKTPVLALTFTDKKYFIDIMLRNGANGYILKDKSKEELLAAIHTVYRGGRYLPLDILDKFLEPVLTPDLKDVQFTSREMEVLRLVAKGMENKEIADQLYVAETTVITHCRNLMNKIGVNNRVKLAIYAKDNGLA